MIDKKEAAGYEPAAHQDQQVNYEHINGEKQAANTLFKNALGFAQKGWAVFPVKPRDKTPLTQHGFKDASKDVAIIQEWWGKYPEANIGVATGARSGFFVLDVDGNDGEESLRKIEQRNGTLPQTVEAVTGGGGRHLFFQWPLEGGIANSAGRLGVALDIRGDGGYVIAPPSIHKSGRPYAWSVDSGNKILPAPAWFLALLKEEKTTKRRALPQEWQDLVQNGVCEGNRNDAIARLSGKLFRSQIDPYVVLEICQVWNAQRCRPPLSSNEVDQIVNSIAGRELARRGG